MNRFIITFGQTHTHRVNNYTFDKDSVAIIKAETHEKAREITFELFNDVFHNCYPEEAFDNGDNIKYFQSGKIEAN